jgi:DNA-binding transcriptional LysR family regulator
MVRCARAKENVVALIESISKSDRVSHFSLDHFVVFAAVTDCGGFAAAARKLGRAQSAVTNAIRNMEEACGLLLFDRSGYRAELTDAGRALLPRARQVLAEVDSFRRDAGGFALGLEAGLVMAVDPFVPQPPLARVLRALHNLHPTVRVRMLVEPHARVMELVASGQAQLGVLPEATPLGTHFESFRWATHELVAVAAPGHPLAGHSGPIPPEALRAHMQVVWSSGGTSFAAQDLGVHATDCWHVSTLEFKRELLRAGAGWGSLPNHMTVDDLSAGRLVRLEIESWEGRDRMPSFFTNVIRRRDAVVGVAQRKLIQLLRDEIVR